MNAEKIKHELSEVRQTLKTLTSALIVSCPYSFYEWLEEWLAYKEQYLTKKAIADLRGVCKNYIKPKIPDKPLSDVTTEQLQATFPGAPKFVQETIYRIIRGAFTRAFALGYIRSNISVNVYPVTAKRYAGRALTAEQVKKLFAVSVDYRVDLLFRFILYSGCRVGEALSVCWSDIDMDAETIHVRGTKTFTSDRTIPFFGLMRSILEQIPRTSDRLFPYSRYLILAQIKPIREKCGFYFRVHDLRHTFATHCMECGISLSTLSKWLGHTSVAVTSSVYVHMGKQWQDEETKKFRNYTE